MQRLARSLNLKSPANAFPFNLRAPALSALASLLVIGVGMGGVAWSADNEADPSSQAVAVQDEGRADELEVGTRRILAALEAGTINSDQAYERLMGLRKRETARRNEDVRRRRAEYARVEKELMAAVKAGRVKEEDAKRRLGEMREHMFPNASGGDEKVVPNPREEYARVEKELKAMVEADKISAEDARRRLSGFRERLGRGADEKPAGEGDRDAKLKRMYDGFERRIKAAVAKGDMTREEAAEKLKAFKERLSSRRGSREGKGGDGGDRSRRQAEKSDSDRANSDVEKIYAAVKAGKLTREEAGKKLRALKSKKTSRGGKDKQDSRGRGDGSDNR